MYELIDEIRALIGTYGFDDCAGELIVPAEPTVAVRISRTDPDSIALGASRFGGVPDLPASVDWPSHQGRQLTLIAEPRSRRFRTIRPERTAAENRLALFLPESRRRYFG